MILFVCRIVMLIVAAGLATALLLMLALGNMTMLLLIMLGVPLIACVVILNRIDRIRAASDD